LQVTYNYSLAAALRKPLTIFTSLLGVFSVAWLLGQIDVSISAKPKS
jgi:oligosaccharyltransferase complex subunit alpha (ribophorin I)